MNNQHHIIELINKEIDGVNSPEESISLRSYLSSDPEMLQYFDHMKNISTTLNQVEEVQPSENLKKRVMNSVQYSDFKPQRQVSFLKTTGMSHLYRFKYAYTLAVGIVCALVIGLVVTMTRQESTLIPTQLYGSMYEIETVKNLAPYSHLDIALNEAVGVMNVKRNGHHILLEVELHAKKTVQIKLSFLGKDIRVDGVAQSSGLQQALTVDHESIKLTANGESGYEILLNDIDNRHSPLTIEVYDAGTLLMQGSIETGEIIHTTK